MYGCEKFQEINAAIWSTTSMLLDDCEQVVAQLRGVRVILENEYESQEACENSSTVARKRRKEPSNVSALPPLPRGATHRQPFYGLQATKRVKVFSPDEVNKLQHSTPLQKCRQDKLGQTAMFNDPFLSPAAWQSPSVLISSDSE